MDSKVRIVEKICYRPENTNSIGTGAYIKLKDRMRDNRVLAYRRYRFIIGEKGNTIDKTRSKRL